MNEKSPSQTCSRCGATIVADALKGLCPRCLVALNLATQTEIPADDLGPHGTQVVKPTSAEAPSLEEMGKLFPQFEIIECLGRGGMGAVYKARQPKLDRYVALKILLPERHGGGQFAERFAREARALARLNHPAIVAVYDFGEAGGYPFLVMEYMDGLSLRQLLQRGKITPEEALVIVPKICEALHFAHQQGIVHRDIKPENILMDKQGAVKIADFGIAKILIPGAQNHSLTGGKDVMGTPHYMAPEQVEQPKNVDHRADIFSLGVVLYEMLTGELPLGRFSLPSSKVRVDVRLDEVVLHALEKEPERRYQHVSEVKSDLETIVATGNTAPPAGVPLGKTAAEAKSSAQPPPVIHSRKKKKGEFLGLGAAVQVLGLVCLFIPTIGIPLGIILLIIGGRMAIKLICLHCGNRTTKHAKICEVCGAHFDQP
jgi:serine/threonine protein kinase/ribosomal protein L40E